LEDAKKVKSNNTPPKPPGMGPLSKYGLISVAGGSLVGQATELLQWITGIAFPTDWPPLPPQVAILVASVLIVWPLALIMPESDRRAEKMPKPEPKSEPSDTESPTTQIQPAVSSP
jgi:hypothetical protein